MKHASIKGRPVMKVESGISAGKTALYAVTINRNEGCISRYNLQHYKIEEKDLDNKLILMDYVSFFKEEAYDKLKSIKFKFK
jgi:hypothetical protein